jgi:hypothetical protein
MWWKSRHRTTAAGGVLRGGPIAGEVGETAANVELILYMLDTSFLFAWVRRG